MHEATISSTLTKNKSVKITQNIKGDTENYQHCSAVLRILIKFKIAWIMPTVHYVDGKAIRNPID